MPELPEAETIVRGLREPLAGARIAEVRVLHPDLVDGPPPSFRAGLRGAAVEAVSRRGKNVVLRLDTGTRLVVNLGMSGRLLWRPEPAIDPPPSHPGVIFEMAAERRVALASAPASGRARPGGPGSPGRAGALVYHDPRRFGRLRLLDPEAWLRWSSSLGPEPLSSAFTASFLQQTLGKTRSPLRSFLLDQTRVAGVGNIYASEACFLARLHPQSPSNRVEPEGVRRLHRAVRKVLREAVEGGGTTLRDYRTAQGWEGSHQHRLRVYGREGDPCPRCGESIRRTVFSNRSAFFCPRCQGEGPEPARMQGDGASGGTGTGLHRPDRTGPRG